MAKYVIPSPSAAMIVPDGELEAVARDAQPACRCAQELRVFQFDPQS